MPQKLTTETVELVQSRVDIKRMLCDEFNLDEEWGIRTINRYLKDNTPNGRLTSKAALDIMKKWLNKPIKDLVEPC